MKKKDKEHNFILCFVNGTGILYTYIYFKNFC